MKKQYIDIEMVKFLMEQRGLSVKDMAKAMKITPQTVRKYLNGADQSNTGSNMLFKFAKALDVPVASLIHRDYPKIKKKE